eukprot:COSAG03_NODE_10467_length_649_cov_1.305455_2_plen_42_part_01
MSSHKEEAHTTLQRIAAMQRVRSGAADTGRFRSSSLQRSARR